MCDSFCRCCINDMCYSFISACDALTVSCDPSHCQFDACKNEFQCVDGYEYYKNAIRIFRVAVLAVLVVLVVGFIVTNSGIKWYSRKNNRVKPVKIGEKLRKATGATDKERLLITIGSDLNSNN